MNAALKASATGALTRNFSAAISAASSPAVIGALTRAFSRKLTAAISHALNVETNAELRTASNRPVLVRVLWPAVALVRDFCEHRTIPAGGPASIPHLHEGTMALVP